MGLANLESQWVDVVMVFADDWSPRELVGCVHHVVVLILVDELPRAHEMD